MCQLSGCDATYTGIEATVSAGPWLAYARHLQANQGWNWRQKKHRKTYGKLCFELGSHHQNLCVLAGWKKNGNTRKRLMWGWSIAIGFTMNSWDLTIKHEDTPPAKMKSNHCLSQSFAMPGAHLKTFTPCSCHCHFARLVQWLVSHP